MDSLRFSLQTRCHSMTVMNQAPVKPPPPSQAQRPSTNLDSSSFLLTFLHSQAAQNRCSRVGPETMCVISFPGSQTDRVGPQKLRRSSSLSKPQNSPLGRIATELWKEPPVLPDVFTKDPPKLDHIGARLLLYTKVYFFSFFWNRLSQLEVSGEIFSFFW